MRYIIVTGGVMSGLGKGITAASIGRILKNKGYDVTAIKIDPYINIDAGTMSPFQHGEVYVLKDGGEVDLDLGNYERFLDTELTKDHNITTGKVYKAVIEKERRGDYLGKTVQIIPHITDEIKEWTRRVARESGADICLVEVGGTVGDIESMPFLEAVRQMHGEEEEEDIFFIHVTLVPEDPQGEQKTKPTQHSVKALREVGLHPDAIVARSESVLLKATREKIALFCDVPTKAVISAHDADDIYLVPLLLDEEGLADYIIEKMRLTPHESHRGWPEMVEKMRAINEDVRVSIVGKYTYLEDAYLSIRESLKHAGIELGCNVDINWVESSDLEDKTETIDVLEDSDGVLVPGGFGVRGTEGKIEAIKYAREKNIPYLGLCFGMQLAVIEFARNVCNLEGANSSELDDTPHPVIDLLPEQADVENMGGTMRLGDYTADLKPGTLAHELYGRDEIVERHRHRYEVNPEYIDVIEDHGMIFSGSNQMPDGRLRMEIAEIPDHVFFFASQFHPEFKSRPGKPSPPFVGFVRAMLNQSQ